MQNSFIFIGRSGAGKGTQAKLLMDYIDSKYPENKSLYIETGKVLREFKEEKHKVASLIKEIYDKGGLMPSFLPIYIWTYLLKDKYTGKENLVFDGTPRKVLEAMALEGVFPFFKLPKPFVIYLDVEQKEAMNRLAQRKRFDDAEAEALLRQKWFETDVKPTVEYFKTVSSIILLDIDGNRTVEEIHKDILEKTGI